MNEWEITNALLCNYNPFIYTGKELEPSSSIVNGKLTLVNNDYGSHFVLHNNDLDADFN